MLSFRHTKPTSKNVAAITFDSSFWRQLLRVLLKIVVPICKAPVMEFIFSQVALCGHVTSLTNELSQRYSSWILLNFTSFIVIFPKFRNSCFQKTPFNGCFCLSNLRTFLLPFYWF